jgi:hypothetical protein
MEPELNIEGLSKKERRERRKQERRHAEATQAQTRFVRTVVVWAGLAAAIGATGYGLYVLATRSEASRPGEEFPIQGRQHIPLGEAHPAYNSNPPTSGWHDARTADWKSYREEVADERLIHNLEHGGIWISYKDIDDETRAMLEAFVPRFAETVVVTPRAANDSPITLASWGRLQKLETYDEAAIEAFIRANLNKSPEPIAGAAGMR